MAVASPDTIDNSQDNSKEGKIIDLETWKTEHGRESVRKNVEELTKPPKRHAGRVRFINNTKKALRVGLIVLNMINPLNKNNIIDDVAPFVHSQQSGSTTDSEAMQAGVYFKNEEESKLKKVHLSKPKTSDPALPPQ